MIFCSSNGSVCANLLPTAREIIEIEIASKYPRETGGILIGLYDANRHLATIHIATGPTEDSRNNSMTFERGVKGIDEKIFFAQKEISPNLHYVGEWHSHPDSSPLPSYTDLKQMQTFAKNGQLGIKSPLLLIVGGKPQKKLEWVFSLHKYKKAPLFLEPLK
jgi:integrative and conjugative element protein (TIGR02256 family)